MVKIEKNTFITLLIISLFIPLITQETVAANKNTLGYYEEKLKEAKQEAANNQSAINKTQGEINASKAEIERLKQETLDLTAEVKKLSDEIDEYNNKREELYEKYEELENFDRKIYDFLFHYSGNYIYNLLIKCFNIKIIKPM